MKLRTGARRGTMANLTEHEIKHQKGNCYFCHKEVDGRAYCFGCNKFVCQECDTEGAFGLHSVKEHRISFQ